MHLSLYPHQIELYDLCMEELRNCRAVMPILFTGGGKTIICTKLLQSFTGVRVMILHRQELVYQTSMTLAKYGMAHNLICSTKVSKFISHSHRRVFGKVYYQPNETLVVASIDTLRARANELTGFFKKVTLAISDEGHHVLKDNKWGQILSLMPNAQYVLPTATAERTDGKGLGSHNDGMADVLIQIPWLTGRWMIDNGFLCDYKYFAPECSIKRESIGRGSDGDLILRQVANASEKSSIIGNLVDTYMRHTPNCTALAFLPSVKMATSMASEFNAAGSRFEVLSGGTDDSIRAAIVDKLRRQEINGVTNVDLVGEGFDLPAVTTGLMGRMTDSWIVFSQQMGRFLRTHPNKKVAYIFDHAGNLRKMQRLPDGRVNYTLERREKRKKSLIDYEPLKFCSSCTRPYERFMTHCPHCGYIEEPSVRSEPKFVDGDLFEVDQAYLKQLRGRITKLQNQSGDITQGLRRNGMDGGAAYVMAKNYWAKGEASRTTSELIDWWAGLQCSYGLSVREAHRKFFIEFGHDTLAAQLLSVSDAQELQRRIMTELDENGVDYNAASGQLSSLTIGPKT